MKKLVKLLQAVLLAAATLAPNQVAAQATSVVATINGGGTANMDDGEGISAFGMGVKLLSDGSANGHFECVDQFGDTFPGNFIGQVTSWSMNADGSVSFSGTGKVINIPGGPFASDLSFTVTIQQFGGAGVGHWTLDVPDLGGIICLETLISGHIVMR